MDTPNSTKRVPQDSSRGIKVLSLRNRIFDMFDDKTRIACLSGLVPLLRLGHGAIYIVGSLQTIQNRFAKIQEAQNLHQINRFPAYRHVTTE